MLQGATPTGADADSHLRYLSGLLLAIGLAYWSTVPRIIEHDARFRVLTFLVVLGGLARVLSLALAGTPSAPMLAALFMELVVAPALAIWREAIAAGARAARRDDQAGA